MAAPIELVKGGERQTVYSENKADALEAEGWQRISNLSPQQQAELASRPAAPWPGFDSLNIEQVLARAAGMEAQRETILAYERATKNRKGIIWGLSDAARVQDTTQELPPVVIERQLEAETGHEVVQTSKSPPTFVETDKPTSTGRRREAVPGTHFVETDNGMTVDLDAINVQEGETVTFPDGSTLTTETKPAPRGRSR